MFKVRQRHFSPWLLSKWGCRASNADIQWASAERGVEVSWTGCFVLRGCSIALIWQGTSQVRIQRWHQAKHPWIGRMRIQRDYAFIKWVKVLEFAPQVESLCLHITHNLQCCYFLLAEPHICISVKEKYEASASPSDKQIGKSKK